MEDNFKKLSETLNPLSMIYSIYCFSIATLTFYGWTSIFFFVINPYRALISTAFGLSGCIILKLVFDFYHQSQLIIDKRFQLKEALTDLYYRQKQENGERMDKVKPLLKRLDQNCLNAPYNFYDISHSSFVQAIVGAVTYLIVLTQFKVSEEE